MSEAGTELREPTAEELRAMATAARTLVEALRDFGRVKPSGRHDVKPSVTTCYGIGRAIAWLDGCPWIASDPDAEPLAVTMLRAAYRKVRQQIPARPDGPPGPVSYARPLVAADDVDWLASKADAVERFADALSAVSEVSVPVAPDPIPEPTPEPTPTVSEDGREVLTLLAAAGEGNAVPLRTIDHAIRLEERTRRRVVKRLVEDGFVVSAGHKQGYAITTAGMDRVRQSQP